MACIFEKKAVTVTEREFAAIQHKKTTSLVYCTPDWGLGISCGERRSYAAYLGSSSARQSSHVC